MKYIKSDIINIIRTLELMEHIRCNEIYNAMKSLDAMKYIMQ